MFKGYNLSLSRSDHQSFMGVTSQDIAEYEGMIGKLRSTLQEGIGKDISVQDKNGVIDANLLKNKWFPTGSYDVFISHSHQDVGTAKRLAAWLKKEFRLNAFIDSTVWGYADDLLKKIDDRYCVLSINKAGEKTYNYGLRNYSTSQVHLMLTTALQDMIDQCECLIFLNTSNSISMSTVIKDKTNSPWIYEELVTTRVIRVNTPERLKEQIRSHTNTAKNVASAFPSIEFSVDKELKQLVPITVSDLERWKTKFSDLNHEVDNPLDCLYSLNPAENKH